MSDLRESVENIVVGALAQQDRHSRRGDPQDVDSRVVTRDIINAIADKMEERQGERIWTMGDCACDREAMSATEAFDWLRSEAPDSESGK